MTEPTLSEMLRFHAETLGASGKPASRELLIDAANQIDLLESDVRRLIRSLGDEAAKRGEAQGQLLAIGFFGSTEKLLDAWRERIARLERENAELRATLDRITASHSKSKQKASGE